LTPLSVQEWGPLVFIKFDGKSSDDNANLPRAARIPLLDQLQPAVRDMDAMDCAALKWSEGDWKNMHFLQRRVYDIKCNWKVYCDNYLDGGYHIPALHKGLNEELDMTSYRTELHETLSIQKCKAKSNRVGSDAVYAFLFPNFAINRYGDWLDTNLVVPVAPDRCVIVFDWYHRNASPIQDTAHNQLLLNSLDQSRNIQDEDVAISESVQCGIGSSTYDWGRYAPSVEIAEFHYHGLIKESLIHYLGKNA
jgi:choline monooxygenase